MAVVVLDVVGTVLEAAPPVFEVYQAHAQQVGHSISAEVIQRRFADARISWFTGAPPAEQTGSTSRSNPAQAGRSKKTDIAAMPASSEGMARALWRQVVADVFPEIDPIEPLFAGLWQHFAAPAHWRIVPDFLDCARQLRKAGHQIVLASNFDSRLAKIVTGLFPSEAYDWLFCSTFMGVEKPHRAFYRYVAERVGAAEQLVWVGDQLTEDYWAPKSCGWPAILLDRRGNVTNRKAITEMNQVDQRPEGASFPLTSDEPIDTVDSLSHLPAQVERLLRDR